MTDETTHSDRQLQLSELRKQLGRSQAEVAALIGTTQSGVSRIERQPDIRVSTLDQYVSAVGGRLRLVVEHRAGSTEIVLPALRASRIETQRREYRVVWQDQATRALVPIGWLEYTGDQFVFSYSEEAKTHEGFKPFPAFPLLDETYASEELFPFFSVRLTSTAHPGYDAILDALGLTRDSATPAELLARSPTDSPHDTIQVIPEPVELADGKLDRTFLVSGVRHADEAGRGQVSRLLESLQTGTRLEFIPEPTNRFNPRALQVAANGTAIGWVPDYLVDEIHSYLKAVMQLTLVVERANGPDTPWHLRALCRLTVAPTLGRPK